MAAFVIQFDFIGGTNEFCLSFDGIIITHIFAIFGPLLHQMKPAWYATSQMNRCFHRFHVFSPA